MRCVWVTYGVQSEYFQITVIIGVQVVCDHVIKQPLQAEPYHYFI